MSILDWSKPAKAMTTQQWEAISADNAPPGVYTPNMSRQDALKWKARYIGGSNPRVEIRKTVIGESSYAQMLIVVTPADVSMSMNGKAVFAGSGFLDLHDAIIEARVSLAVKAGS